MINAGCVSKYHSDAYFSFSFRVEKYSQDMSLDLPKPYKTTNYVRLYLDIYNQYIVDTVSASSLGFMVYCANSLVTSFESHVKPHLTNIDVS